MHRERRKDWQGLGLALSLGIGIQASRRWESAVPRHLRLQWGSKGAPGTVAGEAGQGGFTIPVAGDWLRLLQPTSSRLGTAHSHANPISVERLGPTAQ